MLVSDFTETLKTVTKLIAISEAAYPNASPEEIRDAVLTVFGEKLVALEDKISRFEKRKNQTMQVRASINKAREELKSLKLVENVRDDILAVMLKHCQAEVIQFEKAAA